MNDDILKKVLKTFVVMWLVSMVGMGLGMVLPPPIAMVAIGLEVVLLISLFFVRKTKIANGVMFAITALSGISLYWIVKRFAGELGADVVLVVFISTAIIFILLGTIGMNMKKDISNWGIFLMGGLLALIVFLIVSIFVGFSNIVMLIASGFGVLLFIGYTLYDFNQIKHKHVGEEDVVATAFGLYLDFINLFINLLKVVYYAKKVLED